MGRMKKIAFYITGHGFGHSIRQMSIINKIFEMNPEIEIFIKTNAPKWIYDFTLKNKFKFFPIYLDFGVIQDNFYNIDIYKTLKNLNELLMNRDYIIENEVKFISDEKVSLVIGDIPPLAFEISKRAGIPGIAISNFSWDWIYEPYVEKFPEYKNIVNIMKDFYREADLLLRFPFYGDMSCFKIIKDVPISARKSRKEKDEIRKMLNIQKDKRIVLISFGGFNKGDIDFSLFSRMSGYYFIATEQTRIPPKMIRIIENKTLSEKKLEFEDLIKVSYVVITKPGYGIVSDCIANKTPMIYAERENFREYEVLVSGIKKYLNSVFIPNEDLMKCKFEKYLQMIFENQGEYPEMEINGDEIIAGFLIKY